MPVFSTTEEFIKKARTIHGDRFIYDKVKYISTNTKIIIICKKHGEFLQTPNSHLQGKGCFSCKRKSHNDFIEQAILVHGDTYNYEKTRYIGSLKKVTIICKTHGEFSQLPNNHLKGNGCKKCASTIASNKQARSQKEFIVLAVSKHGNKYNYSLVKYINCYTKISIICPIHGEFFQLPQAHLSGQGCSKCRDLLFSNVRTKNTEYFIKNAKKIHKNKYEYIKTSYVKFDSPLCITCPEHGDFWQYPGNHIKGSGCPKCGYQTSKSKNEELCYTILKERFSQFEFVPNDREKLKGMGSNGGNLEIDIIVKDKHGNELLYIEWNGVHWHKQPHMKIHDKIKKDILGEKLLVIPDLGGMDEEFVKRIVDEKILPKLAIFIGK